MATAFENEKISIIKVITYTIDYTRVPIAKTGIVLLLRFASQYLLGSFCGIPNRSSVEQLYSIILAKVFAVYSVWYTIFNSCIVLPATVQ